MCVSSLRLAEEHCMLHPRKCERFERTVSVIVDLIQERTKALLVHQSSKSFESEAGCGIEPSTNPNFFLALRAIRRLYGEIVRHWTSTADGEAAVDLTADDSEVVSIEAYGSLRIKNPITSKGCSNDGEEKHESLLDLRGTPFTVGDGNTLIVAGCNNTAWLTNVEPSLVGCRLSCGTKNLTASEVYLNGINCTRPGGYDASTIVDEGICTASIPYTKPQGCDASTFEDKEICTAIAYGFQQVVGVKIDDNNTTTGCKVAFLTAHSYSSVSKHSLREHYAAQYSTVELGWFIPATNMSFINSLGCKNVTESKEETKFDPTISCACDYNVHLTMKDADINECQEAKTLVERTCTAVGGTCVNLQGSYDCVYTTGPKRSVIAIGIGIGFGLIFIGGIHWLYKFIKKQRRLNQKKKFFKRNGGILLQQQLTSKEGKVDKTRVFSSRELEKATKNFSTVYKRMLVDGSIVALKKSKVVDEDKLDEFINEIVILSQINHRNIVKLLGCCLETDVPVLVYEFVPNGNLFEHLYNESDDYTMVTWDVRLRIATDISGTLAYLPSAASSPIYHRDIKSTNIMLDEKYQAKISDFGTSRTVTVDHTHLTTVVSGTVGYTDPEYFQSSQFTEKSDVHSFGVVLAELITGERSISFLRTQENRTLSTYFILAMKENKLFDIIDARIRDGCKLNQVTAAAKIARRCLNLKGKKRPTMREVSMELERIRSLLEDTQPHEYVGGNEEEIEEEVNTRNEYVVEVNARVESWNNIAVTAPASQYNFVASSSSCSDVEPLFPLQTR
ncbi:hypothetical protein EUTSA_v10001848mg [Eutrema salsugineum]|uniref:Protein kinase domain-containing protein n=1 Tax=Eutrema salsugineum TaxID=72664 RepID=V4KLU8_EUTSA|nr:hypothetical protein EUTSA_v10001848mg [Eutrema salsugineum]